MGRVGRVRPQGLALLRGGLLARRAQNRGQRPDSPQVGAEGAERFGFGHWRLSRPILPALESRADTGHEQALVGGPPAAMMPGRNTGRCNMLQMGLLMVVGSMGLTTADDVKKPAVADEIALQRSGGGFFDPKNPLAQYGFKEIGRASCRERG